MKKLFLVAFLCAFVSSLHAQTPRAISYQGMLRGVTVGNHSMTLTLYGDAAGTMKLWQSTQTVPLDSSGVFSVMFGSDENPLPDAPTLDRSLWLGIAIDGQPELTRSPISASMFALNVADSSITSKKMATNYISSISVNGKAVSGVGTNIDVEAGNGITAVWDASRGTLMFSGTNSGGNARTLSVGDPWLEGGNYIDTSALQFLGTTNDAALEIHVYDSGSATGGYGRVMRYEPMIESPDITGGFNGNSVTSSTDGGNVIAGGGWSLLPNATVGDFSTVGGGAGNVASNGGTVAGGGPNAANKSAFTGGGSYNYAAGEYAVVAGGYYDTATSLSSTVGGGSLNRVHAAGGTIAGGTTNLATGPYATIGGGAENTANDSASTVAGGFINMAGFEGAVGGGYGNSAGKYSAIPGGYRLTVDSNSFGFNATGIGGAAVSAGPNVAYFGNVDVQIASSDTIARQLQIYCPGIGANYTSFQAPQHGGTVHYILPVAQASAGQILTNDGAGQLFWNASADSNDWHLAGNTGTAPPTNFLGTIDSNSLELHVFDTGSSNYGDKRVMRYEVNDTSANLIGGFHDNGIVPLDTSLHSHIVGAVIAGGGALHHADTVKGSYGVISGGKDNMDTAYAFVGGGDSNRAMGAYSATASGKQNLNLSNYSVIAGGEKDTIDATQGFDSVHHNVIGGGYKNHVHRDDLVFPTNYAGIASGEVNSVTGLAAFIGGGDSNMVFESESSILGGHHNTIYGSLSSIGGGYGNYLELSADGCVIAGGGYDSMRNPSGPGLFNNLPTSSSIGGGIYNKILGNSTGAIAGAVIPGGMYLIDSSYAQCVVGEYNIPQGNSGSNHGSSHFADTIYRFPNDRMFIVGAGRDTSVIGTIDTIFDTAGIEIDTTIDTVYADSAIRFNAFEVTRKGGSIVYKNNGSGGATHGLIPIQDSGAVYGERTQDNTCYAWGDVKGVDTSLAPCLGTMHVNSDYGVDSISYVCKGQYVVFLHTVDPYTRNRIAFNHGFSVTATPVVIGPGVPLLETAIVTPLGWGGLATNAFEIYLVNGSGSVDGEVMFHVFGRK